MSKDLERLSAMILAQGGSIALVSWDQFIAFGLPDRFRWIFEPAISNAILAHLQRGAFANGLRPCHSCLAVVQPDLPEGLAIDDLDEDSGGIYHCNECSDHVLTLRRIMRMTHPFPVIGVN